MTRERSEEDLFAGVFVDRWCVSKDIPECFGVESTGLVPTAPLFQAPEDEHRPPILGRNRRQQVSTRIL